MVHQPCIGDGLQYIMNPVLAFTVMNHKFPILKVEPSECLKNKIDSLSSAIYLSFNNAASCYQQSCSQVLTYRNHKSSILQMKGYVLQICGLLLVYYTDLASGTCNPHSSENPFKKYGYLGPYRPKGSGLRYPHA
jgi:hypothetical protein